MTRVAFMIRSGGVYAEHPQHGWIRIARCGSNGAAVKFIEEHYHCVLWDQTAVRSSGTFEEFSS